MNHAGMKLLLISCRFCTTPTLPVSVCVWNFSNTLLCMRYRRLVFLSLRSLATALSANCWCLVPWWLTSPCLLPAYVLNHAPIQLGRHYVWRELPCCAGLYISWSWGRWHYLHQSLFPRDALPCFHCSHLHCSHLQWLLLYGSFCLQCCL